MHSPLPRESERSAGAREARGGFGFHPNKNSLSKAGIGFAGMAYIKDKWYHKKHSPIINIQKNIKNQMVYPLSCTALGNGEVPIKISDNKNYSIRKNPVI